MEGVELVALLLASAAGVDVDESDRPKGVSVVVAPMVCEAVAVPVREDVALGVRGGVPVAEGVGLAVAAAVAVEVCGALLVTEGDAPVLRVAVGVAVSEAGRVAVGDTVEAAVLVGDAVALLVPVALRLALGVVLLLPVLLAVLEGEAPAVKEGVGDADTVLEALRVGLGDSLPVKVGEGVLDAVGVGVAV